MGEAPAGTPSFEMTWSSTTSSGYCSQEDSDSELEQYFTARTSLVRRPRRDQVGTRDCGQGGGPGAVTGTPPLPGKVTQEESLWASPRSCQRGYGTCRGPARVSAPRVGPGCPGLALCHRPVEPGEAATWLEVDQGRALAIYD